MDAKMIGYNIRQHRKLKGLTQAELAERAELSTMSIRRYESGERIIPENSLNRIAEVLGIPKSLLLTLHVVVDTPADHNEIKSEEAAKKLSAFVFNNNAFISLLDEVGITLELDPDNSIVVSHGGTWTKVDFLELESLCGRIKTDIRYYAKTKWMLPLPDDEQEAGESTEEE